MSGMEDLVVAGGVESMSRVPMGLMAVLGIWIRVKLIPSFPQGVGADTLPYAV